MIYKIPIKIEKYNVDTDRWEHLYTVHSNVNTTGRQVRGEFQQAGATAARHMLTFWFRYSPLAENIALNTQLYRIAYRGRAYNILEYDDIKEQHLEVRLTAEAVE